jgi:hypothetical protein
MFHFTGADILFVASLIVVMDPKLIILYRILLIKSKFIISTIKNVRNSKIFDIVNELSG